MGWMGFASRPENRDGIRAVPGTREPWLTGDWDGKVEPARGVLGMTRACGRNLAGTEVS